MKKINFIIALTISCFAIQCFAQTPKSFNYPLNVTDNNGNALSSKGLIFRISIHQGWMDGKTIYREIDNITTDSTGFTSLPIGSGKVDTGRYSSIVKNHPYFLKIEYKTSKDSDNYVLFKTSPMPDIFPMDMITPTKAFGSTDNPGGDTNHKSKAPTGFSPNGNTDYGGLVKDGNGTGSGGDVPGFAALSTDNTGFGTNALGTPTETMPGSFFGNTAVGYTALFSITTGPNIGATSSANTAIGDQSMYNMDYGFQNTATGTYSLKTCTTGIDNCAYGYNSLAFNNGNQNCGFGMGSLAANLYGDNNTAIGWQSQYNTAANDNTSVGFQSLYNSASSGIDNVAIGEQALFNNGSGHSNVVSGLQAMYLNVTGSFNVASGQLAMFGNQTGSDNVATGYYALYTNATGIENVAEGMYASAASPSIISYTTASGYEALRYNTEDYITGVGYNVLMNNTGTNNTGVGNQALLYNKAGSYNSAFGDEAMFGVAAGSGGSENTAIGYKALNSYTIGSDNTATGYQSLLANTVGGFNTADGYEALLNNVGGIQNTAVGANALRANSDNNNTAIGFNALTNNLAANNTAIGYEALTTNSSGTYNTASGYDALLSNKSGLRNTADGTEALNFNSSGSSNVADGFDALFNNTASWNTAVGDSALAKNTTGYTNVAVGYQAASASTIATSITAVGYKALLDNTASNNTAIGQRSMQFTTTGGNNTALGYSSLYNNTFGKDNVSSGFNALWGNTTASSNAGLGFDVLYTNTGSWNTAIGDSALYNNQSGTYNSALGYYANVGSSGIYSYATAIGAKSSVVSNNSIILGTNVGSRPTYVGIGMSGIAAGPKSPLEISYFGGTSPNPCSTTIPASTFTATCSGTNPTGASGLQFRDLTDASIAYPYLNGHGFLSLDDSGHVVYMASGGGTPGPCTAPTTIPAADGAYDLQTNSANFYFQGNGIGSAYTNVIIGTPINTCPIPQAKLEVLQSSGSNNTIGLAVENTDFSSGSYGAATATIGLYSYIPPPPCPGPCTNFYNVGGWFQAGAQNGGYAIFVPGNPTVGGQICMGYAFNTHILNSGYNLDIAGNAICSGGWTFSDSIVKKNIVPFHSGLTVIRGLNLVSYNYNGIGGFDTSTRYVGVIAENVARYAPYAVAPYKIIKDTITRDTATILTIYDQGILYTAVNAIKQLDSTVNKQTASIVATTKGTLDNRDSLGHLSQLPMVRGNSFSATSDGRYNTSVHNITNAMSILESLHGEYFNWDSINYPQKHFSTNQQIGFDGSATSSVLPQVVSKDDSGYYTIDYGRIVPVLVEGIKQQKQIISGDSARISQDSIRNSALQIRTDSILNYLKSITVCLDSLCNSRNQPRMNPGSNNAPSIGNSDNSNVQSISLSDANSAVLYQNIPNPFNGGGTKINYFLPQDAIGASIIFFDSYGNKIKEVDLSQTGMGTINVNPDNLTNGIYSYSLVIDGQIVDTKRMAFQK